MELSNDYITDAPFDREYRLVDLLTSADLEVVLDGTAKTHGIVFRLLDTDRERFYETDGGTGADVSDVGPMQTASWPLRLEFEEIGNLEMAWKGDASDPLLLNIGKTIAGLCEWMISFRRVQVMTGNLMVEVVEGQHRSLKEKADALEKSQARYRKLAESLEIEVGRKTAEAREAQAELMQQAHLAAIGRLAAGVAHEINNPIGFITSNLNTLETYGAELSALLHHHREPGPPSGAENTATEDAPSPEGANAERIEDSELAFILEDIPVLIQESREGAERIRIIVENLRIVARPGTGGRSFANLNRSIDATLSVLHDRIDGNARVIKRYGSLPEINCNETEINQVLLNILVNALQAIGDDGEIHIATFSADGHVAVVINDNGTGIPDALLPRVFEPFFTTHDVGDGCGLGLTVAYNLLQKHKGRIDIASVPNAGTEVTIRLPIA